MSTEMVCPLSFSLSQRVLEADAAEDAFNDDDDYEVDTPKRRHRGKGRVSAQTTQVVMHSSLLSAALWSELHWRFNDRQILDQFCFFIKHTVNIRLIFQSYYILHLNHIKSH